MLDKLMLVALCAGLVKAQDFEDPLCVGKNCSEDTSCRVLYVCPTPSDCALEARCIEPVQRIHDGVCKVGNPILVDHNGKIDETKCGVHFLCPATTYCNTEIMDTYASCCRSNPNYTVKPGECPVYPDIDRYFCVDTCINDGDCRYEAKCCQQGCKKQCSYPKS